MRKKFLAIILFLALGCLSGCGSGKEAAAETSEAASAGQSGQTAEGSEAATQKEPVQTIKTSLVENEEGTLSGSSEVAQSRDGLPRDELGGRIVTVGSDDARMKVGMVTGVGGIHDHSFNQSAWDGLLSLNEELGARVSYIETSGTDEFFDDLCALAEAGNDICWGVGYQFEQAILDAAEAYPDVHFAIIDLKYDDIPENVTCATFRAEESSFLVGYIAATVSETGRIGFLGGFDSDTIRAFQYGYMAGAAEADRNHGKDTEVLTEYLDTFTDMEKGKEAAEQMYEAGCDVIFHAAGGAGTGVIEAAKDSGRYVIGVDSDQSYLAPEYVLTSAVKMVGVIMSNLPVQYDMGEQIGGIAIEYGLSERAVGIPGEHPNLSDDVYTEAMEIADKIMSSELRVPKTAEEYEELYE